MSRREVLEMDVEYLEARVGVLMELVLAFHERYECTCGHHWCKRCALHRKAAEVLGRTSKRTSKRQIGKGAA